MNFENAKRIYLYRFTGEHVPRWARSIAPNGKYYAPGYATDKEWFENTKFPPYNAFAISSNDCHSTNQSWPYGEWLDLPFTLRQERKAA